MKIAVDAREAEATNRTGKGTYAFELLCALIAGDHSNTYILFTDKEAKNSHPGESHLAGPHVHRRVIEKTGFAWHLAAAKEIKKEKPDVFFAPTSYIIPALIGSKVPTIIAVHDLVAWLFPHTHNIRATIIERLTLPIAARKARHIVAVSQHTKGDLTRILKIPREKISIVSCAASSRFRLFTDEEKTEQRKKYNLQLPYLLAVGTLEPRKNFTTLIKSFAKLHKDHPEYKLMIIGGKGWYYRDIFNQIRRQNLTRHVICSGYIPDADLPAYYANATALVFPSLYEGFGIPPLEAMQTGCPVIASNAASLPEVVADAAILIHPHNENELTAAMNKIIIDADTRAQLMQKGIKRASQFTWAASAHALLGAIMTTQ